MTEIQPVYGSPALTVDNTLVIADLHIGVESHLRSKGFHLVSRTDDMYDEILSSAGDCNKLVVLGDVKNSVPGSSKQEYTEIPEFFVRLTEVFNKVTIVRGNHDDPWMIRLQAKYESHIKTQLHSHLQNHKCLEVMVMSCDAADLRDMIRDIQSEGKADYVRFVKG